jgi:photosystem II stability/assembly factor-like uncharacterized protein
MGFGRPGKSFVALAIAALVSGPAGAITAGARTASPAVMPLCRGGGGGIPTPVGGGVSFVDAMRGWVVGTRTGFTPCQDTGAIVATRDGGRTFIGQQVPHGVQSLSGVSFVNPFNGWAVGQASGTPTGAAAVLATGDGGYSWARQSVPGGITALNNVAFIDGNRGWAVGDNCATSICTGAVIATANGGTTWTAQSLPAAVSILYGVAFVSPSIGWAVGTTNCSGGGVCPGVIATTNGGNTWTSQTVPAGVTDLEGVSFVDASHGWATGEACATTCTGVLLATSNGGATWVTQSLPAGLPPLAGVTFINSLDGWAVGGGPSVGGVLVRTTNGGASWTQQSLPSSPAAYRGVAFVTPSQGWVSATPFMAGDGVDTGGSVLSSVDGGSTWTGGSLPATITGLFDISFTSASSGWAVGQSCNAFGQPCTPAIVTTSNGGGSWSSQRVPGPLGSQPNYPGLYGVSFPTSSSGWTTGVSNCTDVSCSPVIFTTSNGGALWNAQTVPSGVGNLGDITFINASTGWAVGGCLTSSCAGTILATTNGGSTWTEQTVPADVSGVTDVTFATATTGWALAGGSVLKSTNGGTSWTETPLVPGTLLDVTFVNSLQGWVVGQNITSGAGLVMSTGDGGMTWNSQALPAGITLLYGVTFINASVGWAVGDGSNGPVILATSNGGATWTMQSIPGGLGSTLGEFYAVKFADASNGWVVGAVDDQAVILHTSNGGTTWSEQNAMAPPATPALITAVSTRQYQLTGSNGSNWTDIDPTHLTLGVTPTVDSLALVSANSDLWTANAGYNQDLGISVSGGVYPSLAGQPEAWKESGGFAGTFSPNAAFVQTVVPLSAGTTYSIRLQWKTNKADPGTIYAGAGPVASQFSPSRLTAELIPAAGATLQTAVSTQQYQLGNSDGATWKTLDQVRTQLSFTPPVDGTALLGGNADLWTASAGFNQDLGIAVSGGAYPTSTGQPEAWKESGGFAGTFSPNAAYAQVGVPLVHGTTYTFTLVWKTNKPDPGTIFAGAGPIGGRFSPTRLTVFFIPSGSGISQASSTQQYSLSNSDGSTWQTIDATRLSLSPSPANECLALISGNADLWTANTGYNQDIGISVSGGAYPTVAGQPEAWKESGGFAGTFSPNAALVQAVVLLNPTTIYSVVLSWKTNRPASGATIHAGAGPINARFSPTDLSVQLVACG